MFHVAASGAGQVKWQQVSEDLVPVNITCIQDSPECVFHITAYNSQVDKILDVRLVQPGKNPEEIDPMSIFVIFSVFAFDLGKLNQIKITKIYCLEKSLKIYF